MTGCLQTSVGKQSIIDLYSEFETVLKFYNLGARNKQRIKCLAEGHNTVPPVSVELGTLRSQV